AQVAARKTLSASVAGNSAQLDRLDEVIVSEKEATARSLLSLQTDVNGNKASINSLNQTLSDYQQATATQINSITATVNGHTSAITTNAEAIANVNGDLKAMYSIKVGVSSNGQYYAAGMGIGVENTPSGMQSQVIFLADRFAVTTAAGNGVALPFVIQNGQTFIRASFIQDGTIENAKIGNYIQSNNYAAGYAGWKLNKAGDAEFNKVTVRGVVYASDGRFTGEIQATSGKFKGTVEATSFVGDVANMCVIAESAIPNTQTTSSRTWTKTFKDSSGSALSKDFVLLLSYSLTAYTSNQSSRIIVTANIGGTSITRSIERAANGPDMDVTIPLAVKGKTASSVTISVKEEYTNVYRSYLRPSVILMTRGTGSWS
ncbi:TPA: DUF1983 domain-containing protein, partial [Escherichia coli]|nr:DUF1983 domain-containing protein [Escherichia coli]